jgi:hypothetical protein
MRILTHTFAFLALISGFNSKAAINGSDKIDSDKPQITWMQTAVVANGIYKFTENTDVTPSEVMLKKEIYDNQTGGTLSFEKGEAVAVEFDVKGNALLTPLLADEEQGKVPEQLIVTKEEFLRAHPEFFSPGDFKTLADNFSPYVEEQHGWRSPGNCSSPPVGTVASWSGGWHGKGHTGIWNGRCYASDTVCGNPGASDHFLGCAIGSAGAPRRPSRRR